MLEIFPTRFVNTVTTRNCYRWPVQSRSGTPQEYSIAFLPRHASPQEFPTR
jgi:hypothetical protein